MRGTDIITTKGLRAGQTNNRPNETSILTTGLRRGPGPGSLTSYVRHGKSIRPVLMGIHDGINASSRSRTLHDKMGEPHIQQRSTTKKENQS